MEKSAVVVVTVAVLLLSVTAEGPGLLSPGPAICAAQGEEDRSPYGGFRGGAYGEKRAVATVDDARRILHEYFGKRGLRVGDIREKELYFEADILDPRGAVVDKVIVNRRNGRIRSIY
ncbi:MAG: hypothetical protein M0Z79_01560 [Nitrospiraceae bacterium]|nr:hypothetical protein [Nitrospiraceae bacterium]